MQALGRVIFVCVLVTLLFVPVLLISSMKSVRNRLIVIWISSTIFILFLAMLTKAKTSEVFMAGATYATVLVVFVAGNGYETM